MYCQFSILEEPHVNLSALLRGSVQFHAEPQLVATSSLSGQTSVVTEHDLRLLKRIPSGSWLTAALAEPALDFDRLYTLAVNGLVVTDSMEDNLQELRRRDEQLSTQQWNPQAAIFHFATRWRDVSLPLNFPKDPAGLTSPYEKSRSETYERFLAAHGDPPGHFYSIPSPMRILPLTIPANKSALCEVLAKRKTTRVFDSEEEMGAEQFSSLIYYVYGCHGYSVAHYPTCIGLKKTSPSGGSLHPIEVYPLIINVAGIDPGLYHYSVKDHSLELLEILEVDSARQLADQFTAGQKYPQWASALFIMTARFYRNYWKYRSHTKAYKVVCMDAAHLSQTFYLVCADLGLGAFVTAAINDANIEERLHIDSVSEGVIAISGCGIPLEDNSLDPEFLSYIPRSTVI